MATAEKTKKVILIAPSRKLSLPIRQVVELPEAHANKLMKDYRDVVTEEEYQNMLKKDQK